MDQQNRIRLTEAQRVDWLRLIRSENIGPRTFLALLRRYGSARAALDALPDLARRGGAKQSPRICSEADATRELAAAARLGVNYFARGEPEYPSALRAVDDAPPLLAVRGLAAALVRPMVALVGSRNASGVGLKMAERLAHQLGAAGFVVVSGLARGIDAAAHRSALASGTVAVLAGGQDKPYPPDNVGLLDRLLETGAAISEMPMGWEPRARDFPRRNRLISGVSLGVIIVEAAQRSGSLITARMALEQGREVFAVPGSPLDPRADGTNGLLKQGATLVTEAADVIAVLRPMQEVSAPHAAHEGVDDFAADADPSTAERDRVLQLLGPAPIGVDDLIRLAEVPARVVRAVLLELEIAGRVERHGGGLVSLVS